MINATLVYARDKFSLTKIAAIVLPDNVKSISLLEKSGFKFERRIRLSADGEELLLYGNE